MSIETVIYPRFVLVLWEPRTDVTDIRSVMSDIYFTRRSLIFIYFLQQLLA